MKSQWITQNTETWSERSTVKNEIRLCSRRIFVLTEIFRFYFYLIRFISSNKLLNYESIHNCSIQAEKRRKIIKRSIISIEDINREPEIQIE